MSNEKILDVFKKHETEGGVYLEQGIINAMIEYAQLYHAEQLKQVGLLPKQQLWNMANVITEKQKAASENPVDKIDWNELEGEWFDWLEVQLSELLAAKDREIAELARQNEARIETLQHYHKTASDKLEANKHRPLSEAAIEARTTKALCELLLNPKP